MKKLDLITPNQIIRLGNKIFTDKTFSIHDYSQESHGIIYTLIIKFKEYCE